VSGAVLGPLFIEGMNYFKGSFPSAIRPVLGFLSTGVGLIVVLLFLPGGFGQLLFAARDRYLRWVAARHGIEVPSLTADSGPAREGQRAPDDFDVVLAAAAAAPVPAAGGGG
jgi:hypothetical protein